MNKIFVCDICDIKIGSNVLVYAFHMENAHNKIVKFKCDACVEKFSKWIDFKNHSTLFHGFKQKHEEENNIYSNHDKANLASNELNKEKIRPKLEEKTANSDPNDEEANLDSNESNKDEAWQKLEEKNSKIDSSCEKSFVRSNDLIKIQKDGGLKNTDKFSYNMNKN